MQDRGIGLGRNVSKETSLVELESCLVLFFKCMDDYIMNCSNFTSRGISLSNCQHGGSIGCLDLEVLHN